MATFGNGWIIPGLLAGANLATHQYKMVKPASTAGEVIVAAGPTDKVIGILQNDPGDGEVAAVMALGISKVVSGTSVLAAGTYFTCNTTGQAKAASVANTAVVGFAISAPAASGDIFDAVIIGRTNF